MPIFVTQQPSRVLIRVATNSPTLSKSGVPPFTITLEANVDHHHAVTGQTFRTLLRPDSTALYYEGLVFRDKSTGEFAPTRHFNLCYDLPEQGLQVARSNAANFAELPPKNTQSHLTVSRTFRPTPRVSSGEPLSIDEHCQLAISQTSDFEVGHEYEIELGESMSNISWWQVGKLDHVLAEGERKRLRVRRNDMPALAMVLVNCASFTVVE